MEKMEIIRHHYEGILSEYFGGIYDFCRAKEIAEELILGSFRKSTYPNTKILVYPFMSRPGYNPDKLATAIAFAALAVNSKNFCLLPEPPIYGAFRRPDIICRACGNLLQRTGSNTEYDCRAINIQKRLFSRNIS